MCPCECLVVAQWWVSGGGPVVGAWWWPSGGCLVVAQWWVPGGKPHILPPPGRTGALLPPGWRVFFGSFVREGRLLLLAIGIQRTVPTRPAFNIRLISVGSPNPGFNSFPFGHNTMHRCTLHLTLILFLRFPSELHSGGSIQDQKGSQTISSERCIRQICLERKERRMEI
jgi:hypothetical protein